MEKIQLALRGEGSLDQETKKFRSWKWFEVFHQDLENRCLWLQKWQCAITGQATGGRCLGCWDEYYFWNYYLLPENKTWVFWRTHTAERAPSRFIWNTSGLCWTGPSNSGTVFQKVLAFSSSTFFLDFFQMKNKIIGCVIAVLDQCHFTYA